MEPHHRSRNLIRFGIYEVDPESGELRKSGIKIRLQEQPFQVLVTLLEQHGQIVTREDLREKVWPGHTFVDFDQGLNTAIAKIREVLGDSASNPRFVETVPRRGYRFIAPVELPEPESQKPASASDDRPWWQAHKAQLLAIVVVAMVLGGAAGFMLRKSPEAPEVPLRKFSFTPADPVWHAAISPDGKHVAYTSGTPPTLWLLNLDSFEPRRIDETEGARRPFWSPDSRFVAIIGGGSLRKVSPTDGSVMKLCDTPQLRSHPLPFWSPDGSSVILVRTADGVPRIIAAGGGELEPLPGPVSATRLNRSDKPLAIWSSAGKRTRIHLVEEGEKLAIAAYDMETGAALARVY